MDTTTETKSKAQALIENLGKDQDIIDTARRIEARPETTRGRYADYMAFISPFREKGKGYAYIIGQALIRAGGSWDGVTSALQLLA
jgi:hypothetical protein